MQGFSGWFWGLCHYLDSPLHRCALQTVQVVCWYIDICALCKSVRKAEACDVNVVMVPPNLKVCERCSVECAVLNVPCAVCMQCAVLSV